MTDLRRKRGELGMGLLYGILFLGLVSSVVTWACFARLVRYQAARDGFSRLSARYAAEAGGAAAMSEAVHQPTLPSSLRGTLGRAAYEATIARTTKGTVMIRSIGRFGGREAAVVVEGSVEEGGSFRVVRWADGSSMPGPS